VFCHVFFIVRIIEISPYIALPRLQKICGWLKGLPDKLLVRRINRARDGRGTFPVHGHVFARRLCKPFLK
jgi:hypothetical protein